jgi:hypothetical protein
MTPLILPTDETAADLKTRLHRIKSYRTWALEQGFSHHVLTEGQLKEWLSRSGYEPKLSKEVFA